MGEYVCEYIMIFSEVTICLRRLENCGGLSVLGGGDGDTNREKGRPPSGSGTNHFPKLAHQVRQTEHNSTLDSEPQILFDHNSHHG